MSHNAKLSWTPGSGGDAPTGYQVNRGTVSGQETNLATVPATQTNYEDDTVQGGDQYFYTVQAVNADGASTPSNEASALIPLALPASPTSLAVSVS